MVSSKNMVSATIELESPFFAKYITSYNFLKNGRLRERNTYRKSQITSNDEDQFKLSYITLIR